MSVWIEQVSNSPHSLLVVHAVSSEVAWAVGDVGQVVVTVDGGLSWVSRPVGGTGNLRGLFAFDGESSVVADQTGDFWRTTDGGLNWVQVHTGAGRSINGIHFFDAENGWAMGDPVFGSFVILDTTDGGVSWIPSPNAPPAAPLMTGITCSYDWVGTEIGIFSTTRWLIWRTTNGGTQWDSVRTGVQFIVGVELSNTGIGLASGTESGEPPILERSMDFGQTWGPGQHPPGLTQALRNYDWIEGTSEVWGVTSQQGIYQSTDEGQDWIQHILADPGEWVAGDIGFIDTNTGWCVGTRSAGFGPGRIFKYSSTTGITVAPTVPAQPRIPDPPQPLRHRRRIRTRPNTPWAGRSLDLRREWQEAQDSWRPLARDRHRPVSLGWA
jgi:photosystem II stability/assembly factor-like uncharacterized protein